MWSAIWADFIDYNFHAHAKAVISIGDQMQAFILITTFHIILMTSVVMLYKLLLFTQNG